MGTIMLGIRKETMRTIICLKLPQGGVEAVPEPVAEEVA